jgi:hypothetical protein
MRSRSDVRVHRSQPMLADAAKMLDAELSTHTDTSRARTAFGAPVNNDFGGTDDGTVRVVRACACWCDVCPIECAGAAARVPAGRNAHRPALAVRDCSVDTRRERRVVSGVRACATAAFDAAQAARHCSHRESECIGTCRCDSDVMHARAAPLRRQSVRARIRRAPATRSCGEGGDSSTLAGAWCALRPPVCTHTP